jgi:hypothetical protein
VPRCQPLKNDAAEAVQSETKIDVANNGCGESLQAGDGKNPRRNKARPGARLIHVKAPGTPPWYWYLLITNLKMLTLPTLRTIEVVYVNIEAVNINSISHAIWRA